jgi:SRSO17 transposase
MPALDDYLRPFHVHFARPEATRALERYLTGMFTQHPNKDCDTIAAVVPGTSEQSLQGLLTAMRWDEDDLNRQRVHDLLALPTEGDAALLFDDTGFAKQGKSSAGVARQYSGTLGKVGNCQVAVNCHYAERTIAWPVATRLYLPKEWFDDPGRLQQAKAPEGITFQTKPQIALGLLDQADQMAVPYACVVADADYGDNPNFLAGLEERTKR